MVMPAWRSRGIDRAVFVVFVWSGTCVTCAPWKGAIVLCEILRRLARTSTGLCSTCSVRDIARLFQCVVLSFGVQFVRNMPFALHHAWRLLGFRSVVDEHVCWSLFSCAVNSFIELHLYYIGPHVEF